MIRLKGEGLMSIWMELSMSEIGQKTGNKGMVQKLGLMVLSTKVIMKMEKSMGSAHLDGLMDQYIQENFKIIISTEKVCIHGQIIENMKENGDQTKCTEKGLLYGQMAANIWENMQKTKKKDMENLIGRMVDATEESGLMENSMEKGLMLQVLDKKNTENGKKEKESDGLGEGSKIDSLLKYCK